MSRLLIHDIDDFYAKEVLKNVPADFDIVQAFHPIAHCVGCFGCWVRTPGRCVIDDAARDFVVKTAYVDELIIISRLSYGGLSPDIKAYMDRSIPVLQPFFEIRDNVMRHPSRTGKPTELTYYFYSDTAGKADSEVDIKKEWDSPLMEIAADNTADPGDSLHPSEDELYVMKRLAEANGKNLGAESVNVTYIGDMFAVKDLEL